MNNHHNVVNLHVMLPLIVWGDFFEKMIFTAIWKKGS